jgi:hypothetical protein
LPGDDERLLRRHDSQLLARVIDDADFPHPDPFVHPRAVVPPGASVESYKNLQRIAEF